MMLRVEEHCRSTEYYTVEGYRKIEEFSIFEMDKIAWQKPFSSASDFAIKKSKKINIFLI